MIDGDGPRATILLVEDDPGLATMLRDRLGGAGYYVWWAETAAEAEALAGEVRPDLIILDLMLPGTSGLVLCAELQVRSPAPIIICSGTRRRDEAALGFALGAVDFLAKPFSLDQLDARVEVALRRAPATEPPSTDGVLRIGALEIDRVGHRVRVGGEAIHLTPTEYRLLCCLAERPDAVLSREELAVAVWGAYDAGIGDSLAVHLRRLRAKLKRGPDPALVLVAVRGFGYRLAWEPGGGAAPP